MSSERTPDSPGQAHGAPGAGPGSSGDDEATFAVQGAQLEPEEMAALTAVLAQARAEVGVARARAREVRVARPDRTLRRRRDLGLWARPGEDQWRRTGGWR